MDNVDSAQWGFRPKVKLINFSVVPPITAQVAAARSCYSSNGIILPDKIEGNHAGEIERASRHERNLALARDVHLAGHNTTEQHSYFTFAIDDVSRQLIWQVLHAHPFYNSEQVSQRYTKLKGNFVRPPLRTTQGRDVYESTVTTLLESYDRLNELLLPIVSAELISRFPKYKIREKELARAAQRKAQEIGRYVAPVAATAFLHHTVSMLSLLRYRKAADMLGVPQEGKALFDAMYSEALARFPEITVLETDQVPLESTAEYDAMRSLLPQSAQGDLESYVRDASLNARIHRFRKEFDERMAASGNEYARLAPGAECVERNIADAVRNQLCVPTQDMPDSDAIRYAMDSAVNGNIGTSENTSTLSPIARAMLVASYTFEKRLSHTGSSQDQRHRMTPSAPPVLSLEVGADPDYLVPKLVHIAGGEAERVYHNAMNIAWDGIRKLLSLGESAEHAQYLFTNAKLVRFSQGGLLSGLAHKHAMRQCLNAQEEVWQATMEEAAQISRINPIIGQYLLPPCGHRYAMGVKPACPEGERFCGVLVWKKPQEEFRNYKRTI